MSKKLESVLWKTVKMNDGFWRRLQKINRDSTIPTIYNFNRDNGRIEMLRGNWSPDNPLTPHFHWDSDNAKFIEAAAYSIANDPDPELEAKVDEIIDLFEKAQGEDGYLNTYISQFCPEHRFQDLLFLHELYCAGHMAEAAVAYYQATGKRKFLDVVCRYMDYIDSCFGPEPEKCHGYPGHPEIELALYRLWQATGNERYYRLGKYFLDARGQQPYYYDEESRKMGLDPEHMRYDADSMANFRWRVLQAKASGETPANLDLFYLPRSQNRRMYHNFLESQGPYAEQNAHRPVRDLESPAGHAVRAGYLYSAMADYAEDDEALRSACLRLWKAVTQKQMYITGGIGQTADEERFSYDYDCPNETAYSETCANIALCMWARRMLQLEGDSQYADILERALYNSVISGVSYEGGQFFYANHLALYPKEYQEASINLRYDNISPVRITKLSVACCPANLARTIASIGQYVYSISENGLFVHLYDNSSVPVSVGGQTAVITQSGNYPWDGKIRFDVACPDGMEFDLMLRIPGWCKHYAIKINGREITPPIEKGYAALRRAWNAGDMVELTLTMEPVLITANPKVRQDAGRVAIQRGPLVYCIEEVDNGKDLNDFAIDVTKPLREEKSSLFGGIVAIRFSATRSDQQGWENTLYREGLAQRIPAEGLAIPYYLWANRGYGEMVTWIRAER